MIVEEIKTAVFCSAVAIAAAAFGASSRDVRVYDGDYPDASECETLKNPSEWIGTAWLKSINESQQGGTQVNEFGNPTSTVRFTDCEFSIPRGDIGVTMEFVDDEDSQKPALFIRDLEGGVYTIRSVMGDGTLKVARTSPWTESAVIAREYSRFMGSIETDCAFVFGNTTDRYESSEGRIVILPNNTVTIAEDKHFSAREIQVDGTLIVNGKLSVDSIRGSGLVILSGDLENWPENMQFFGDEGSTIMLAQDLAGEFPRPVRFNGNLDLDGNTMTLTGGNGEMPFVFNRLVGSGVINVTSPTRLTIKIENVLDDDWSSIAYQGRIIGNVDVDMPEDFKLDSRGYIVHVGEDDYHYVTVPKMAAGVFVPVAMNLTACEELEDVEEENYEFYVYRVPAGDSIAVDITTPFSNVVVTAEAHFATVVNEDIDLPLPTGLARGLQKLETRGPFIHEIWFDENWRSPADGPLPYAPPVPVAGYCSAVHNGNFVGRNLDYFVNDMPMFAVHMSRIEGVRFASLGIGSAQMHEDDVTNGLYTCEYSMPPLGIFDGINENGVVIEENVVPLDDVGALEGTNPGKPDLHIVYVPRYVLDHATNAVHAIELLQERNLVGDLLGEFSFHFLIADKDESYVVEFIDGKLVWRKMEISTNFNLCWNNETKTAITNDMVGAWTKDDYPIPYAPETTLEAISNFYTDAAMGVERFITLREHYDEGATLEGMLNLMKRVQYSQTYSLETAEGSATGPSWWVSESCSGDLDFPPYTKDDGTVITVERSLPQLYKLFKTDCEYFSEFVYENDMIPGQVVLADVERYRSEYTGIWYTTHTAVYDIANRSIRLCLQEDYERRYDFSIPVEWTVGDGVTAAWDDGILSITGAGKVDDFASAADLPWAGHTVTNMTLAAGVTPGKNTFAGLEDTATLNGTVPISLLRAAAGDFIVGSIAPAEASALAIEGGQVRLTVEVDASTDLETWKRAWTDEISVPVEGEKGFYILKSK